MTKYEGVIINTNSVHADYFCFLTVIDFHSLLASLTRLERANRMPRTKLGDDVYQSHPSGSPILTPPALQLFMLAYIPYGLAWTLCSADRRDKKFKNSFERMGVSKLLVTLLGGTEEDGLILHSR